MRRTPLLFVGNNSYCMTGTHIGGRTQLDAGELWMCIAHAGGLYGASCGTCHAAHPTEAYLANQWVGNLKAMNRCTSLDDGQYRLLLAYLQLHAKDAGTGEAGAAKPGQKL